MATSAGIPQADLDSFHSYLKGSKRILALLGAGLSASSGLPTFRGAGGLWRDQEAVELATPEAFATDPALVWQFYSYRRHMALAAQPNAAHWALAALAKKNPESITLSQNVDGLSPRANHPSSQLHLLHGSLFDVRCSAFYCDYTEKDNFHDPIVPALALPSSGPQPEPTRNGNAAGSLMDAVRYRNSAQKLDVSDASVALPPVNVQDLPRCPKCHEGLLRPGVVWFGESLPKDVLGAVDSFINNDKKIDLIMVIGTSARVFPAASYVSMARQRGARVAVVNTDAGDAPSEGLTEGDWFFVGDASVVVPEILQPVIGKL